MTDANSWASSWMARNWMRLAVALLKKPIYQSRALPVGFRGAGALRQE
jgi:hypothetical protein